MAILDVYIVNVAAATIRATSTPPDPLQLAVAGYPIATPRC